ncbi:putative oxidoreductase YdgJ [Thalassoglobus neptunius]|uniref:Putative oxidoreductase YdgJ n=1 Tax=Thalassoglobus neptunius TaxID=1938619 RepID=A0A5C5X6P6_9PLAN|nr:Gfo/Idh/MocA family oxidoreductase [Thalassoglobus neptunius]TWT58574.1 putative oxidoreductase YdgJ [Thalassoglobus neptunius]
MSERQQLRGGMVGVGMIFDETYRPFFETAAREGLYDRRFGLVDVRLAAIGSRTGTRAEAYRSSAPEEMQDFVSVVGPSAVDEMLSNEDLDFACVATPDDRHFEISKKVLQAGKHLLIEKPSVLKLDQLDELIKLSREKNVLAKVVYHKLLDPDHKKLRTLVADNVLQHVNNGYCTLLEPKLISGSQFSEWITGRNPGTYVAVHYIKLIDYTFGGRLKTVQATGQRGLVRAADSDTWDSVQMRLIYEYEDGREAAFDLHTSWVTPDNFPGYVEQEVQFRFDNGVWNGHSRKRGVELTVEGRTPLEMKQSINNHYNGSFLEPWGERSQRGYGIEVIERFVREVACVELGGPESERIERLKAMQSLPYNDVDADRQVVCAVQALEAILYSAANGQPDGVARVNDERGGLVLYLPGKAEPEVLYEPRL